MPSGLNLLFCGHHFNKHVDAVVEQGGVTTTDERDSINIAPSVSASV